MLPETTIRLAKDFSNIIAVKEASGSMEQIMEIIQNAPSDFLISSGDDAITLPILAAGGHGVISVVGNGFPKPFKDMVVASMNGEMDAARKLHYKLFPIIPALFAEGYPAGIKEVLRIKGIMTDTVRLPLINISKALAEKIQKMTNEIDS